MRPKQVLSCRFCLMKQKVLTNIFLKRIFQCKRKSNRILSLNFINGQYTLYSSALALNQTLKEKEKARQRKNKTKNKK